MYADVYFTNCLYHLYQCLKLKNKLILTTRNPYDVAVSLYHHHIDLYEIYGYSGEFNDWLQLFVDGKGKSC